MIISFGTSYFSLAWIPCAASGFQGKKNRFRGRWCVDSSFHQLRRNTLCPHKLRITRLSFPFPLISPIAGLLVLLIPSNSFAIPSVSIICLVAALTLRSEREIFFENRARIRRRLSFSRDAKIGRFDRERGVIRDSDHSAIKCIAAIGSAKTRTDLLSISRTNDRTDCRIGNNREG